jgi:hypothetical protein
VHSSGARASRVAIVSGVEKETALTDFPTARARVGRRAPGEGQRMYIGGGVVVLILIVVVVVLLMRR